MKQWPLREADSRSSRQEVSRLFTPHFHYCVFTSLLLDASWASWTHFTFLFFISVRFVLMGYYLPIYSTSPKWYFRLKFLFMSCLPHARYMTRPPCHWFDRPKLYLAKSKNYEVGHYAVISNVILSPFSWFQIFSSAIFSQTPSVPRVIHQ